MRFHSDKTHEMYFQVLISKYTSGMRTYSFQIHWNTSDISEKVAKYVQIPFWINNLFVDTKLILESIRYPFDLDADNQYQQNEQMLRILENTKHIQTEYSQNAKILMHFHFYCICKYIQEFFRYSSSFPAEFWNFWQGLSLCWLQHIYIISITHIFSFNLNMMAFVELAWY